MNLIKLLCIVTKKITGNVIYPLGPKVVKEIIHLMKMGFEITNVGYLLQSLLFLMELPY